MARLARSQPGLSRLRAPAAIGPPVTFRPLQVALDPELTRRAVLPQRKIRSRLAPPSVVGPAVVFGKVRTPSAPSSRLARAAHPHLYPPAVVAPAPAPPTIEQLRTHINLTRKAPVRVKSTLKPPSVIGPGVVFGPVHLELAPSSRLARASHPKLKPPAVVSFPVTEEQRYVSLWLAPSPTRQNRRRPKSFLGQPAIVGAAPVLIANAYLEGWRREVITGEADTGLSNFEGTTGVTVGVE